VTSPKLPNAAEYEVLGRALRTLRRKAGLTQRQAAERVGIRSQFVSEVERGRRGMRWHTLTATVRAYKATLKQLADEIERGEGR
jgi:transcriptional regulator with XRE-family HTH domain